MESLVHYSSPAHSVSLLSVLNEQRLKGQFCDVVLMVGENRFPAHRCILAASSEYFQTLFSRRDSENRNIIHLDFCEPEAFEIVINYVYTSSLFVDKGSLAVIQELGYSLGIPFLTNIMSARPQASYCVSRKRLSFCEDDGTFQKRSVIVHQGGLTGSAILPGKASRHTSGETAPRSGQAFPTSGRGETGMNLSRSTTKDPENKTFLPSILKNHPEYRPPLIRPQLTSSVSFSESVQHLNSDAIDDPAEEIKPEPAYHPKHGSGGQQGVHQQTVDRSGPLIKSLLRRSLSMDSPVPVFSPVLELKDSQSREHSVVKSIKTEGSLSSLSKHLPPLVLRAKSLKDDQEAQGTELTIKREASSPLADPSEIIRITVEDNLPVSFKDFQSNYDENPRYFSPSVKRKMMLDASNHAFKRSRVLGEHRKDSVDSISNELPRNSGMDKCEQEPGELRPSKTFKCWSCMKVFRSNAGLYRHINMYHNPEKPYSCDICHKRFHTNFKVWTHCQTQHGVVQNPAASSSSYSVLDEKLQRKLIDIVREREIKKALIMKLRRNKQAHQGQPFSRKSRRSRSYGCPYCGKMFYFQSHFKLHMKGHIAERANIEVQQQDTGCERQDLTGQVKDHQDKEVFPCRLCNEKLSSPSELEDHERACRYATVCPYCGLRFSNTMVKKDHETHCKYKKLTCLECMRTFKSSFSIWRHQVEVHNQNMMTVREQLTFGYSDANRETTDHLQVPLSSEEPLPVEQVDRREDISYGDSEDSSNAPEDLSSHSQGKLVVKEEPQEELVTDQEPLASEEPGVWPCEKCGKLFSSHKTLERHQELLCHIKPFICHICHKAFRTNFRLWSHYQSHSEDPVPRPADERPCSPSPSPPLTIAVQDPPTSQASSPTPAQSENTLSSDEPRALTSSVSVPNHPEPEETENGVRNLVHSRSDNAGKPATSQESDTLFYHAPTLSALTFKRQYMCKLCHRTFKTAFSLWSHEQSHGHI